MSLKDEDVSFAHFDGQMGVNFKWTIEFDRLDTGDLVLYIKHWSSASESSGRIVASAGPIVSLTVSGRGMVSIVLEDQVAQKWVKVSLPSKKFSGDLNMEWISQGEISIIGMGFFVKSMTTERIAQCRGLLPMEIVYGFQYVKTFLLKNPQKVATSRTWQVHREMLSLGIFSVIPDAKISQKCVFWRVLI